MYGPPPSDSEDEDGLSFGDEFDEDGNYKKRSRSVYQTPSPLRKEDKVNESLCNYAQNGDIEHFRKIYEENRHLVNINRPLGTHSLTALMYACHGSHFELVKYLVNDLKADVNKSIDLLTPMMLACSAVSDSNSSENDGRILKIVKLLVEQKAGINVRNRVGETPFMFAISNGYDSVVEYLLNHNVSLEACDNTGNTALFYAVNNNRYKIAKMLLDAGAFTTTQNRYGDTPKQLALYKNCKDIENLFPAEAERKEVSVEYFYYNTFRDLIPTAYPDNVMPAYMPDVFTLLNGMRSANLEYLFYESQISLTELLTITDERLKQIGVIYPFQRKRILLGLLKFHAHRFSSVSLHRIDPTQTTNLPKYFNIFSGILKHLIIMKCTLAFCQRNDLFRRQQSSIKNKSKPYLDQINCSMKAIQANVQELKSHIEKIDTYTASRPPLFIDANSVNGIVKSTFRKQLYQKLTMFLVGSFSVGAVLCVAIKIRK